MLLRILIVSALLSVVESIGLAPGLYCGLETCYEGKSFPFMKILFLDFRQ